MKGTSQFNSIAKPNHVTISKLLNALENPDNGQSFIHVAGTNGKGSVCAYLQSILTSAGLKTGKFTSPHMICERERITVDGQMIPQSDFVRIMGAINKKEQQLFTPDSMPTRFEEWLTCALVWFKECQCDYSILETGLGGTQDATNVIKNPVMTVITQIALDHTELLGDTIEKIAGEKAGIIKRIDNGRGITVSAKQNNAALDVLKKSAENADNLFIAAESPNDSRLKNNVLSFCYKGIKLKSRMIGKYQAENASVAAECALILGTDEKHIISGIYNAQNPGRFEILSKKPLIIFDGAHNPNGIKALTDTVNSYFKGKKLNIIMAFMKEKDSRASLDILAQQLSGYDIRLYAVRVTGNKRSKPSDEVLKEMLSKGFNAVDCQSLNNAFKTAELTDRLTIICGSLYLYQEFFDTVKNKL